MSKFRRPPRAREAEAAAIFRRVELVGKLKKWKSLQNMVLQGQDLTPRQWGAVVRLSEEYRPTEGWVGLIPAIAIMSGALAMLALLII
jgi:hypothetical protein